MLYCSIDIETTGLDPERNEVLSIGCIIEDTTKKLPYEEIPKFYGVILRHEITGSPRAIIMNNTIIDQIGAYMEGTDDQKQMLEIHHGKIFYKEDDIIPAMFRFLIENGFGKKDSNYPKLNGNTKHITINVAGKNFGTFDKVYLMKLPWFQKLIRVRQRILDPSILCVDWINDETLPSLTECKTRLGIEGIVTHNALEDAWDVIQVLRKKY
jgi:hypothetical protein